jgi:glycosyltransferase involved in cell wall biosynthesis
MGRLKRAIGYIPDRLQTIIGKRKEKILGNSVACRIMLAKLIRRKTLRASAKISVVIPGYNCAKYLEKRLDSIKAQSVHIFEIILLDDASTDNSVEVAEKWSKKRKTHLKIFTNKVNSGSVFAQWKKGVQLAQGDFVWIAEADDMCRHDFLSIVSGPLLTDESFILSYCESRQIDEHGNLLADNYDHYLGNVSNDRWKQNRYVKGSTEITESLSVLNSIPNVSAVLFRRSVLQEVMNRYSDEIATFSVVADHALYVRLLGEGNIAYNRKNANIHRKHANSITAKNQNKLMYDEIIRVQNWVLQRYELSDYTKRKLSEYRETLKYNLVDSVPDNRKMKDESTSGKKAVLVLGMHRSGTSLLTKILCLSGTTPPENLLPPSSDNPVGYWEAESVIAFNDYLLEQTGNTWKTYEPIPESWFNDRKRKADRKRAIQLIKDEFGSANLIALKCPRLCRLAPFWAETLQEAGYDIASFMIIRNPEEVFRSLAARSRSPELESVAVTSPTNSALLWLRYVLDSERHSREMPRTIIRYDELVQKKSAALDVFSQKPELGIPPVSEKIKLETDSLFTPELRRQRSQDVPEPIYDSAIFDPLQKLLKYLQNEDLNTSPLLDRLTDKLDHACRDEKLFRISRRKEEAKHQYIYKKIVPYLNEY